jgi:hypothetical protein
MLNQKVLMEKNDRQAILCMDKAKLFSLFQVCRVCSSVVEPEPEP